MKHITYVHTHVHTYIHTYIGGCIQKFPDWPPGARTANGIVLCHQVQLYRYFVSQSSEFCRFKPLCCFSTSFYCCCYCRLFCCRFSPETFGYTLVHMFNYLGQTSCIHGRHIYRNELVKSRCSRQRHYCVLCLQQNRSQKSKLEFWCSNVEEVWYGLFLALESVRSDTSHKTQGGVKNKMTCHIRGL